MSVTEVIVPKLGLTIESVEIGIWLVRPGDHVSLGDALVELNADKADFVVESPTTGTVAELLAQEGDQVPLTTVIARITNDVVNPPGIVEALEPSQSPVHVEPLAAAVWTSEVPGRVRSSPYARRLASESDINIASLTGSGPGGRVVARDVEGEQRRPTTSARSAAHSEYSAAPIDLMTSCTWELTLPFPDLDRTALYLACASAAVETLGLSWTGRIWIILHEPVGSHHSVLSDWRDLTPEGLRRRLGGLQADQSILADLIVHDLDALDLHTWTPGFNGARTIILGATKTNVTLSSGPQPSLSQIWLVPVTLALPGQVETQPIAAFRAALQKRAGLR